MQPQISICRKRETLYLKLTGDFNETSWEEILCAVKKLVRTSLQVSPPDGRVDFAFQTRAKVGLLKRQD